MNTYLIVVLLLVLVPGHHPESKRSKVRAFLSNYSPLNLLRSQCLSIRVGWVAFIIYVKLQDGFPNSIIIVDGTGCRQSAA